MIVDSKYVRTYMNAEDTTLVNSLLNDRIAWQLDPIYIIFYLGPRHAKNPTFFGTNPEVVQPRKWIISSKTVLMNAF